MNRLLTALACAVLAVLCATGTGQAQTRVTWGNIGGSNDGQRETDNVGPVLWTGTYSGGALYCPTSCDVDSVIVTIQKTGSPFFTMTFKVGVYDANLNLMDSTAEVTVDAAGTVEYKLALINGFSATAGTLYSLAVWSENKASASILWVYTSVSDPEFDSARFENEVFGVAWPDPHDPTANIAGYQFVGGFVGYTAAAGDAQTFRRRRIIQGGQ